MRKTTLVLSLTTAAFAASTLYLANKLYQLHHASPLVEDALAVVAAPRLAAAQGTARGASSTAVIVPTKLQAGQPAVAGTAAPAAAKPGEPSKAETEALASTNAFFARQQLARLEDPTQRAALLAEARANLRRQFAHLRDKVKMSDANFEQLLTLMAEQNLQAQEIWARCASDPKCNVEENSRKNQLDDRSQELLALIGADQFDEFERYRGSLSERDVVAQLRGRLNEANSIRDDQAESLASALAEERERFSKEAATRGSTVNGWGTSLGMIMYSNDSNSVEQRLAEAAAYSQRLRQRAATVLTPTQLTYFNQMQDELLAQMAAYLRPASTSRG